MKRKLKRILVFILMVASVLTINPEINAYATKIAVPSKTNKGIKSICKYTDAYLYIRYLIGKLPKGVKTIKMNKYNRALMVVNTYSQDKDCTFDGSEGNTKIVDGLGLYPTYSPGVDKFYKNLFGKEFKDGVCKGKWVYFLNNGIYILAGDYGTVEPKYNVDKITSIGDGKFVIKISDYEIDMESQPNKKKKLGNTWITVKKNNKSSYGYVITKIKYKR